MIHVMTLDAGVQNSAPPGQLRTGIQLLRHAGIDLLCCQSTRHCTDGEGEMSSLFAETLDMTYSCFAAGRHHGESLPNGEKTIRGLAMLTGSGVWVLNSGSFTVGKEDEEEVVQFALIRKNGASVLALNLHLSPFSETQIRQLRELFSYPLLKEKYGAVVLCADRPAALSRKEWQGVVMLSNYGLHGHVLPSSDSRGLLCLLTARAQAPSEVIVRSPDPASFPTDGDSALIGMAVVFDMQRVVADKHSRPSFPLSFREQWLGYREHRAFA
jgi:hypothetical protein